MDEAGGQENRLAVHQPAGERQKVLQGFPYAGRRPNPRRRGLRHERNVQPENHEISAAGQHPVRPFREQRRNKHRSHRQQAVGAAGTAI
ncbi:hypothetical protein SDC9_166851 [bioreactor metagenome]|uniref:Uncharacterized protein n=1 Tax=bioreactor metagenome TaxID=1076179 RepID=A0A645G0L6_9ZZZZ